MSRTLPIGSRLDRYQVVGVVGQGGVATVYRARHLVLGTDHALKVLDLARPDLLDRLLQEARVQAHIRHPNVVAVSDVVEQGDLVAMVMEFVDGEALDRLLEREGPLPADRALALFRPVLAGVRAAHAAGVLHRDIKPANILVARDGTPKITDFGIAKAFAGVTRLGRTAARARMGTPGYMAPEQWADSAAVDARADVFSLAVVLYEMLAGRLPFEGSTPGDVARAAMAGEHLPLDRVAPDVPAYLARAVAAALAPEPGDRPPSVAAFEESLVPAAPAVPRPAPGPARSLHDVDTRPLRRGADGVLLAMDTQEIPLDGGVAAPAPPPGPERPRRPAPPEVAARPRGAAPRPIVRTAAPGEDDGVSSGWARVVPGAPPVRQAAPSSLDETAPPVRRPVSPLDPPSVPPAVRRRPRARPGSPPARSAADPAPPPVRAEAAASPPKPAASHPPADLSRRPDGGAPGRLVSAPAREAPPVVQPRPAPRRPSPAGAVTVDGPPPSLREPTLPPAPPRRGRVGLLLASVVLFVVLAVAWLLLR